MELNSGEALFNGKSHSAIYILIAFLAFALLATLKVNPNKSKFEQSAKPYSHPSLNLD